jgi:hypothetical protein
MFNIKMILFKYLKKILSFLIIILKKYFIKILILIFKYFFNYNDDLIFIVKEMLNDLEENNSNSDNESEIIELQTEEHKESMKPLNFDNFNNLNQKEKSNYIYQQMYNKAIEPNQPLID